jgi:hypothetical protein
MTKQSLAELGRAALQRHDDDIKAATPKFLRDVQAAKLTGELAMFYLHRLSTEKAQARFGIPVTKMVIDATVDQPGQSQGKAKAHPRGSISVRKHEVKPHRRRTTGEKLAAIKAASSSAAAIYDLQITEGRALGNLAMGELHEIRRRLARDTATALMPHVGDASRIVLLELIEDHCQVDNQLTKVRDAIKPALLAQFYAEAEIEGPRRLARTISLAAAAIESKGMVEAQP